MGSADGTSINTNHLACTWRVEMKRRYSIKEEGENEIGDREKHGENTVASRTNCVIEPVRNI